MIPEKKASQSYRYLKWYQINWRIIYKETKNKQKPVTETNKGGRN